MPLKRARTVVPVVHRLEPTIAMLVSPIAVAAMTGLIYLAQMLVRSHSTSEYIRPYGIGYVLPIAVLSIVGGRRAGMLTLLLSALSLIFFLKAPMGHWVPPDKRDWLEFVFLLFVGSLLVLGMDALYNNMQLAIDAAGMRERLLVSEERRAAFNREVLLAVTAGRLMLCDRVDIADMLKGGPVLKESIANSEDAARVRCRLRDLLDQKGMRTDDLLLASGEAATNAIKHARHALFQAWITPESAYVLVSDRGKGIPPADLARAILQHGYSTQTSLGMGFSLILRTCDRVLLSTSDEGTDILLVVGSKPLPSPEEDLVSRYRDAPVEGGNGESA